MTLFRLYEQGREIEDILLFWLTEYIRRNSELQHLRDRLIEKYAPSWEEKDSDPDGHILFEDGYPPLFSRPHKGDIDNIILQISDKTFTPKIHPDIFSDGGAVTFEISNRTGFTRGKEIIAKIDSAAPKELIINDISLFIDHFSGKNKLTITQEDVVDDDGNPVGEIGNVDSLSPGETIIVSSAALRLIKMIRYNKNSDISRAIGLWLWDRVKELGNTRGAKAQAVREFEQMPYFDKLELGYDPDYYHFLRRTEACIKSHKVLSFDKKS